ncbi:MAG TPA: DUF2249 domain-containing protein [Dermatophilaceae bacterium]|nr:DUF2249 domain-containing protein [Dermatophilaceae bacterium]
MTVDTTVEIATSREDAEAVDAVRAHHAELSGALTLRTTTLTSAAAAVADSAGRAERARHDLVEWCRAELVPHALAEETAMYPAAQSLPEGRLLVSGMLADHAVLTGLVGDLADAVDPVVAAGAARALHVLFESHLAKENDLLLPLLLASPAVSVADLLQGMHTVLGGHEAFEAAPGRAPEVAPADVTREEDAAHGRHRCTCGGSEEAGHPELDARSIPHAIRHATIFGALDAVSPGAGLVLVAPHDPLPLLAQAADRYDGAFTVDYLERGPEAWRLLLTRVAPGT